MEEEHLGCLDQHLRLFHYCWSLYHHLCTNLFWRIELLTKQLQIWLKFHPIFITIKCISTSDCHTITMERISVQRLGDDE